MDNNNNNNGRGIFYGVMGVATLIVTIVGATFAYFAATANTTENAVRTTGAVLNLKIEDINDSAYGSFTADTKKMFNQGDLIPVDADGSGKNGYCYNGSATDSIYMSTFAKKEECQGISTNGVWNSDLSSCNVTTVYENPTTHLSSTVTKQVSELTSQSACTSTNRGVWTSADSKFKLFPVSTSSTPANNHLCVDIDGNNICSVYTFTLSNESTTSAQTTYLYLGVSSNSFTNLHYAVFKGTPADIDDKSTTLWDVHNDSIDVSVQDQALHKLGAEGRLIHANSVYGTATQTVSSTDLVYINNSQQTLNPKGQDDSSQTYTIITWIQETGLNQTTNDSGKALEAFLFATTSDPAAIADPANVTARSGVTGNMNIVNS